MAGVRSDEAHTMRITVERRIFKERQWERVLFPECGKELDKWSLVTHRQTQNGVAKGKLGSEGYKAYGGDNKLSTYKMDFPKMEGTMPCPFKGCSGQASTCTAMMIHFWHRYVRDTMVILDEGNISHPRCSLCDMMLPWESLNRMHRRTEK